MLPSDFSPPSDTASVWVKLHTRNNFVEVPLRGLTNVYSLCSSAHKIFALEGIGKDCLEVTLVAPPGLRPEPAVLAAAFSATAPLFSETSLSVARVVAGSWLVMRITYGEDALAAANASFAQERRARLDAEAIAAQAVEEMKAVKAQAVEEVKTVKAQAEEEVKTVKAQAEVLHEGLYKELFMAWMLSISSSSSGDTASHADETRRKAPIPTEVPLAFVLVGVPEPDSSDTQLAWNTFTASHHWVSHKSPKRGKLDENRDVHPTIKILLEAVVPTKSLRLWCNVTTGDDIAHAQIKPDFSLTHARDAMASTIGSLLIVEVKLPGDIHGACSQTRAFLRRSIHKRCMEADERGEAMDGIFAFGLATDGQHVVVLKMLSGAPLPGAIFKGAVPCPVLQSPAEPLLGWDFLSAPPVGRWRANAPPPGFSLLHRLCAAPPSLLAAEMILSQLTVQLHLNTTQSEEGVGGGDGGGGGGGGSGSGSGKLGGGGGRSSPTVEILLQGQEDSTQGPPTPLRLTVRLGCGGSSDAYECFSELQLGGGSEGGGSAGEPLVVKVSRVSTALVQACFERERRALVALSGGAAQQGLVPTLLASGTRERCGVGEGGWPVLLLLPRGQSLSSWVEECVAAADNGGGEGSSSDTAPSEEGERSLRVAAVRQACASAMALRVLEALELAHAASFVHCDVRPSNIVWVASRTSSSRSGGAMLLDWGISRAARDDAHGCGVAAYADRRVFEQHSYSARPAQDVIGLLLAWLCVAHNPHCEAPWPMTGTQDAMFYARKQWLEKHSKGGGGTALVGKTLRSVEEGSWYGKEAAMYDLVRKALSAQ